MKRFPYAQLSDSTNQIPLNTSGVQVTMNTNDGINGLTHSISSNTGNVTIIESGVYFIMVVGQGGRTGVNGRLNHHIWLRKNTTDIPNTNASAVTNNTIDTTRITSNCSIRLISGDIIKVYQSVDDSTKSAGLIKIAPAGEPIIPSIIFTMYKISD